MPAFCTLAGRGVAHILARLLLVFSLDRTSVWAKKDKETSFMVRSSLHRRTAAVPVALLLVILLTTVLSRASVAQATGLQASDGPGATSYFDLARKDCVGTAENTGSKVWFTLAHGVLSDVYFPTIDNTNVSTLQYIVTDGSTFTDLQTRDMTYTVRLLDRNALDCQVVARARSGRYQIVTDYLTDPGQNTLVMQVHFQPLVGHLSDYRLYARYDPTINGNGGGGSTNAGADSATVDLSSGHALAVADDTTTATNAANRTYAVPVYSALDASRPFVQVSSGFVGAPSDGLIQLDTAHALTAPLTEADQGNVEQTVQLDLRQGADQILTLGFGTTQALAVSAAQASLAVPLALLRQRFVFTWQAYDAGLIPPSPLFDPVLRTAYYLNANVLKAAEDKTFPGAEVASLASPWGQAVPANTPGLTYFGSYREVFARDLYEAWSGFFLDGDRSTARDLLTFLLHSQQLPDGSMPRNSLLNGKLAPDSGNVQLDEAAYPLVMAYQLGMTDADLYQNHIKPAANFISAHGPAFGVERWEEQSGYSPSTISAEIAGLVAAASIARVNHDLQSAQIWLGVADDWQRSIERYALTSSGPLANHPYYIRLSKTGDPNAAISYNLGNGGPTLDQRAVIDAGFLELVRLGLKAPTDPAIAESLAVVDATIETDTPGGPGYHRYNGDGYGDNSVTGQPWATTNTGTGHVWPVLDGERGEYALATGNLQQALRLLSSMQHLSSGVGLIPEQDWELPALAAAPFGSDPTLASIGFLPGQPAGSASPLTWSAAQYVRLLLDIQAGRPLERPANTYDRYVLHLPPTTSLSLTSPANNSSLATGAVTVAGTATPGDTVFIAATGTDNNSITTTTQIDTDPEGNFSAVLTVSPGVTVINVVAVSPAGGTAHQQVAVVYDFTPGTVLLNIADPAGDDHGPGNYAYPTASDFHQGAFDITEFQVILSPDGATTTFKLQVADLSPTFGSPLGAQLVDIYVHDPGALVTSTSAAFASRNYTLAAGAAWSRLLEVQGFGQAYRDAAGNGMGVISISANALSRFITFSVPTASLGGTPAASWGFTVVLTGQDGFSPDQARAFTSTPGAFTFGVCAVVSSDPHCTVDPGSVPKVTDTLTPAGTEQTGELDYTLGPVVLQDVSVP
jgi:glucoamylase